MFPPNPTPTSSAPSPAFKDRDGREWIVAVTIGSAARVKEATGVNFGDIRDGQVFLELGVDPFRFAGVLWTLCEAQAQLRNVTPESFAEALDGDVIDAAMDALVEALILFTRAPMRGAIRKVIAAAMRTQAKTMEAVETWATTNQSRIDEIVKTKTTEALATLGAPSPN